MPLITLILPAYNEVKRIAQTIKEAQAYFDEKGYSYEIIVSADGNDGTRELVREMAQTDPTLKVIGSEVRSGKGYGIRKAVELGQGQFIGFADADNKTSITEFDKIMPHLQAGSEVVIGSRGLKQSRIERAQPLYRQLGSRAFGLVMHTLVGLPDIIDTQCGFKFFQKNAAHNLFRQQQIDGYMFDVEILYLAQKAGYRIEQVPISWRDDGDSRLVLLSGNIRNGMDILRIRFGRTRSRIASPISESVKH